eukprot:3179679-Amphidinium_carterae.1
MAICHVTTISTSNDQRGNGKRTRIPEDRDYGQTVINYTGNANIKHFSTSIQTKKGENKDDDISSDSDSDDDDTKGTH